MKKLFRKQRHDARKQKLKMFAEMRQQYIEKMDEK